MTAPNGTLIFGSFTDLVKEIVKESLKDVAVVVHPNPDGTSRVEVKPCRSVEECIAAMPSFSASVEETTDGRQVMDWLVAGPTPDGSFVGKECVPTFVETTDGHVAPVGVPLAPDAPVGLANVGFAVGWPIGAGGCQPGPVDQQGPRLTDMTFVAPTREEELLRALREHGAPAGREISAFLRELKRPRKPGDTRTMKDIVDEYIALEKATTSGSEPPST